MNVMEVETIALKRFKIEAYEWFDGNALVEMKFSQEEFLDELQLRLLFKLKTNVMAETLEERTKKIEFYYPATWFQHLKEYIAGTSAWAKRTIMDNYPIKHRRIIKTYKIEYLALYPKLSRVFPREGRAVFKVVDWLDSEIEIYEEEV